MFLSIKDLLAKICKTLYEGPIRDVYFIGDYTAEAQSISGSLTTSSSDNDWLVATLKAICKNYPNEQMKIFKGQLHPNSYGYFEICIYNTSDKVSNLPRYCHGTWRHWQNTFWIISTNEGAFSYSAK